MFQNISPSFKPTSPQVQVLDFTNRQRAWKVFDTNLFLQLGELYKIGCKKKKESTLIVNQCDVNLNIKFSKNECGAAKRD